MLRNGGIIVSVMIVLAPGLFASPAAAQGSPIVIQADGVPSSQGTVRVDVCTIDTFLKTTCPYSGVAPALEGETTVIVDGVPPGIYAVQLFHDRNDSGHLARGALGIPKESIGFSNDAPLGLHGPRFARAAFAHGEGPQTITVTLRHFGPRPRQAAPTQAAIE